MQMPQHSNIMWSTTFANINHKNIFQAIELKMASHNITARSSFRCNVRVHENKTIFVARSLNHIPRIRNKIRLLPSSSLREDATPSDGEIVPLAALPASDSRFSSFSKILIPGATGGVGRAVVKQLAEQGITVRAMVRDGTKASSMLPSTGVEIVEGNVYRYQDVALAMQGCDAVICCTGPTDRLNPFSSFEVDYRGTENLVAAAQKAKVKKFVLVTSIGVDDVLFPLNLFFGVLFWKKQGELALQRSDIDYTIIRPGGLLNEVRGSRGEGGVVAGNADTFGLPPRRAPGSILRTKVAEGCVSALVEESARNKVIEVVQESGAMNRPWSQLFASV